MSRRLLCVSMLSFALFGINATAKGGKCNDIAASITLNPTAAAMNLDGTAVLDASGNPVTLSSAVDGDGNNLYTSNMTIQTCDTQDAILNLQTGGRKISIILPSPIANSGNSATPPSGTYTANGVINVRNIVCQGCANPGQPFVTRAGIEMDSMFNGLTYFVWNMAAVDISTLPLAPDNDPNGDSGRISISNSPNENSLVIVLPQHYDCTQSIFPSWIVRNTLPNQTSPPSFSGLAALAETNKHGITSSSGEFSMPFEFRIQALSCFHPY